MATKRIIDLAYGQKFFLKTKNSTTIYQRLERHGYDGVKYKSTKSGKTFVANEGLLVTPLEPKKPGDNDLFNKLFSNEPRKPIFRTFDDLENE